MASTFGLGRSDSGGNTGLAKPAGMPKGKGRCLNCQKDGHWKRDCHKRKADEAKEASEPTTRDHGGLAFTVTDRTLEVTDHGHWIVDSGASQHLCSSPKAFTKGTYQQIMPRGIEIADRSKIEAVGMGEVVIGQLRLSNVLFVPQIGGNLLSVARIINSGYKVAFTSERCTISKQGICLKGDREGNLYYIQNWPHSETAHIGLATNKSLAETLEMWHRRLGHRTLDEATVGYLLPRVSDFTIKRKEGNIVRGDREICSTCATGRQHKEGSTGTREKTAQILQVVHSDICGPMQVSTITGEKYFITFIDEKSGRIAVTLLQRKDQALEAFQAYQSRAEKEAGRKIEALRTDGGGEYARQHFQRYLKSSGIVHRVSPPYTPSQNGLAERANRTLMEGARCMKEDFKLKKEFWGYAVATAAHIHNRLPSRSHEDRSPLQHWTGTVPSIGYLRVFGSVTYTLVPAQKRSKFDARSTKCILVGYDENSGSKVYRLYDPTLNRIVSSRDVIIDEKEWIEENENTS